MIDIFSSYSVFFAAAAIGAHSNFVEGFRQRDVRFLLGMFLNWVNSTTKGVDERVHNTQIARFLDGLVSVGHATRKGSGHSRRYQLTRGGLLGLVEQMVSLQMQAPVEHFFFVFYFVKNYGPRLTELSAQKESKLPKSAQIELSALLDSTELLHRQKRAVQLELQKLEGRIFETEGAAKLARDLVGKGRGSDEIVASVEQMFPYDLNSVKPMSELFREVPPALRLWELTSGNDARARLLWRPFKTYLMGYLEVLEDLR